MIGEAKRSHFSIPEALKSGCVNNGPLNNTTFYDVSIPIQCLTKPDLRTDAGCFLIHAALAALPEDGDVMHDLPTQIEEQREPEPGQAPDVGPDHARREGETPDIRPTQAFGGFSQRIPGFGPESEDDDGEGFGDSSGRGPGFGFGDSDDESGLGEEFEDSDDEFGLGEDSSRREPDTGPENQDDEYELGDVAVPNLLANQSDLSALRDRVGGGLLPNATPDLPQPSAQPYLSIRGRTAADTPLDEWATDGGLLSLTFPSLYPY
ncbi:hypothetical protein E4U25_008477, partial [Claviceps purpurea]